MPEQKKSHFALVLPGAVAKGAFEAGVVQALCEQNVKIDRIVATSSGALNGLAYAAAIRAGREKEMADLLVQSWIDNGEWNSSLNFNPLNWFKGSGLSGREGILKMMRDLVKPCTEPIKHEVELRLIVSPLNGILGQIGDKPATTFEKMLHFQNEDFDTQTGLDQIFDAVTAACAFPGLFAPVELPGLGPCIDGGAVNNAPIKYALDESDVNRVMMVIPFPAVMPLPKSLSGLGLLNHLIEILINERLYRDLNGGQVINQETDKIENLVHQGIITREQFETIKATLEIRKVEITEIRPTASLKQSAFSGFFKKADRINLVAEGRQAALDILERIPVQNPQGVQTT